MADVSIRVSGKDEASGPLKQVAGSLGAVEKAATSAQRALNAQRDGLGRFVAGAKQAESAAMGAGKSLGFLGTALSTAAGFLAAQAIQRVTGALAGMAGEALNAVASHERLVMSLESLTARELLNAGAAQTMTEALAQAGPKAAELVGWIQKLAIQSPFTQEGVASAFRTAQAYGFTTVQAQRLTQAMIDFAAGSGASEASMHQIALALGQIQAKGKLSGQEVLQLVNAGLAVDQILAKAFGKSTAEIVKMREDGLIPADQAITAIVESLEHDFGGAARRQAGTFAGLIASLHDIKEVGLRGFFTGTFEAIQPLLDRFVDTLSDPKTMASIRAMGDALGRNVAGGLEAAGRAMARLRAAFATLRGSEGVQFALVQIEDATVRLTDKLPALNDQLRDLRENLHVLAPVAQAAGAALSGLLTIATETLGKLDDIAALALEGLNTHLVTLGRVLENVGSLARNLVDGNWKEAWEDAKEIFGDFALSTQSTHETMNSIVKALTEALAQAVVTTMARMGLDVVAIWENVVHAIIASINTALQVVNSAINTINSLNIPGLRKFGTAPLIPGFGNVAGPASPTFVDRLLAPIREFAAKAEQQMGEAGDRAGAGFVYGVQSPLDTWAQRWLQGTFPTQLQGASDAINATFGPGSPGAVGAGKGADKIQKAYESAVDKIRSLVSQAIDLSINVGPNDELLRKFGFQGDAVNEAGRRLQAIIEGHGQEWISFFPELLGLDGDALKASAIKLQQDIENFLRPDLLNKEAIIAKVRDLIVGQRNKAQLIEEITQQLIGEGFVDQEIQQALGAALGGPLGAGMNAGFTQALQPFTATAAPQLANAATQIVAPATKTTKDATDGLAESINDGLISAIDEFVGGAAIRIQNAFADIKKRIVDATEALQTYIDKLASIKAPVLGDGGSTTGGGTGTTGGGGGGGFLTSGFAPGGTGLVSLASPALAPAAAPAGGPTLIFQIDARGATMTRREFEAVVREVIADEAPAIARRTARIMQRRGS